MEKLHCEDCGVLIGYGQGDLNCCEFWCPACADLTKIPAADAL